MRYGLPRVCLALFLFACVPCVGRAENRLPWEGKIFEAEPETILAAVKGLPAPNPDEFETLLSEETIHIDAKHRVRRTKRYVYRVNSRESIDSIGTISADWSPWLEDTPKIRARVVSPDGTEYRLDAKTLTETAAANVGEQTYRNDRILTGPIPGVTLGAIVETEVITNQHTAFCERGILGEIVTDRFTRDRCFHLEISADKSLNLRLSCVGESLPLETQKNDGQQVWTYTARDTEPIEELVAHLPPDVPVVSFVSYSTGATWNAIAKFYYELTEEQLKDANVEQWSSLFRTRNDKRQQVLDVCQFVFNTVRYTGLEFGENSIRPATPAATLSRRFGDCKDQATLMVAILRDLGIDASVALLLAGTSSDLQPESIGLNAFDHVILRIHEQKGLEPMWIDMTAPNVSFGQLPTASTDRYALIAAPETKELIKTAESQPETNRLYQSYRYELAVDEPTRVSVSSVSHGEFADNYRAIYANLTQDQIRQSLRESYEETQGLTEINRIKHTDCHNISDPGFTLEIDYMATRIVAEGDPFLIVSLNPGAAFNRLPYILVGPEYELPEYQDETPREHLYHFASNFKYKTSYEVVPPPGFKILEAPEDYRFRVGPMSVEMTSTLTQEGILKTNVSLDTGDAVMSAEEVEEFRYEFLELSNQAPPDGWYIPIAVSYLPRLKLNNGDVLGGVRDMVEDTKQWPASDFRRHELAMALLAVGLGNEARELAKEMTAESPDSLIAHRTVGWTLMHDLLGRECRWGMDRDGAMRAFKKVFELDSTQAVHRYNYALLVENDAYGGRYTNDENNEEAIRIYRELLNTEAAGLALQNLAAIYAHQKDLRALRSLSKSYPNQLPVILSLACAEAHHRGARSADRSLQSLQAFGQDTRKLRGSLIGTLRGQRSYEALRKVLEAFPETPNVNYPLLSALKPFEEVRIDPGKPESALQHLLGQFLYRENDMDALRQCYIDSMGERDFKDAVEQIPLFLGEVREVMMKTFKRRDVIRDVLSLYEFRSEGNEEYGFRVVANSTLPTSNLPRIEAMVVRTDAGYRIVPYGFGGSGYGRQAFRWAKAGNLEAAKFWMEPTFEIEKRGLGLFDGFAGTAFARIRSSARSDDKEMLELAALLLANRHADQIRPDLVEQLEAIRPSLNPINQLQIDRSLLHYLRALGRHEAILKLIDERMSQFSSFADVLDARINAELTLNRFGDVEESLKEIGNDPWSVVVYTDILTLSRDGLEKAYEYLSSLSNDDAKLQYVVDTLPWRGLFLKNAPSGIQLAREALGRSLTDHERRMRLHTLACVYAHEGRIELAAETLGALRRVRNGYQDPIDSLILGRIAHQCGLLDAAKKYYKNVEKASHSNEPDDLESSVALARRWTELLEEDRSK